MQNTMHPVSSPSIEYSYSNQLGSLACQKINCNRPQHFSLKVTEKKRSQDESEQAVVGCDERLF